MPRSRGDARGVYCGTLTRACARLLVALVALGDVGCMRPSELRVATLEPAPELADGPPPRVRIVPEAAPPPTPEALLEDRLAAFAAAVEAHRARTELAPPLVDFDTEGLSAAIASVIDRLADEAMISVHVRDLASDDIIFDYFGDTPLTPASNLKLVTTAAAIDLLGPDYTFTTEVRAAGDALYLIGAGDPSLDHEALGAMVQAVADWPLVGTLQRIVADDQIFSRRRVGPGYRDDGVGEAYEAASGALSLDFNTVLVTVYPVRGASRPAVRLEPESTHVEVQNLARVSGSQSRIAVESKGRGGKTIVTVSGRMPAKGRAVSIRRRVDDPALYTAGAFASALAERTGTEPLPTSLGDAPLHAELVIAHESPPLIEVADSLLAYSNNFMAEQLLRTLGWRLTGEPGDWENGLEVLRSYWSAVGLDPDALVVENGSGLSEVSRVTTSGLVDLMAMAKRWQAEGASLLDVLPVAGETGTMKARLRLSGKRVRAKTGTLDGVSGLSGVITAEDGTPQTAFSILINVKEGASMIAKRRRQAEDQIVMAVLRHVDEFEARRGFLSFEPLWVFAEGDEAAPPLPSIEPEPVEPTPTPAEVVAEVEVEVAPGDGAAVEPTDAPVPVALGGAPAAAEAGVPAAFAPTIDRASP